MTVKQIFKQFAASGTYLRHFGNIAIAIIVVLTSLDVCGRYFFNSPVTGTLEITEYLMLIMVSSFLAYTQHKKSHINVDIVFNHLPARLQFFLNRFNHLVCFIMMLLMVYMGIQHVMELAESGEGSTLLKIPDYPFAIVLVIGFAALAIEFLKDVILGPDRIPAQEKEKTGDS